VPEFSLGSIPGGRANFQMANAFTNAINLVKSPANFMRQNRDDAVPVNTTILNYVVILAAIPFIATLVGDLWYYGSAGYAVTDAISTYIFEIIGVIVIGVIIWKLAPSFGTTTSQSQATLLAAFVYTPFFLISVVEFIPFIGALSILGLIYGLYILWMGLPIMLGTRPDKVLTYFIVILVIAIIVYVVIGSIVGAIAIAFFLR
jgi:Yip1 domain